MTHPTETSSENRLIFPAPVSDTCAMQIWYQKPAPNRTLFYFQARNWRARNWNDDLSPVIVYFCHFL